MSNVSLAHTKRPTVIHIPHASTLIPPNARGQFMLDDEALVAEAVESADLWTDLLAREVWPEAIHVEARVSSMSSVMLMTSRSPWPGSGGA